MYNKTLELLYNSIQDEKYLQSKDKMLKIIAKLKNKTSYNMSSIKEFEMAFDLFESIFIYLKNIKRMGYSVAGDSVDKEYNQLIDIEDIIFDIYDNINQENLDLSDKDEILYEYRNMFNSKNLQKKQFDLEYQKQINSLQDLYYKYNNCISDIIIDADGKKLSLTTALNTIYDDEFIYHDIIKQINHHADKISSILRKIKKIQLKCTDIDYNMANMIAKQLNILPDMVHYCINYAREIVNKKDYAQNHFKTYSISKEKANNIIKSVFATLGKEFEICCNEIIENEMIDTVDRPKKQPGTYSNLIHLSKNGIGSMTYENTFEDVCRYSHEVAHICQGMILSKEVSCLNFTYSTFSMELFAILIEGLVAEAITKEEGQFLNAEFYHKNKLRKLLRGIDFEDELFLNVNKDINYTQLQENINIRYGFDNKKLENRFSWLLCAQYYLPEYSFYNYQYIMSYVLSEFLISKYKDKIELGNKFKKMFFKDLESPCLQNIDKILM